MTYRDELEADRARIEALERENAELHARLEPPPDPEKKTEEPAKSRSKSLGAWPLLVVAWLAMMLSVGATGCTSGTMKLAAPLLCPKGYDHAVVVLHVGGTVNGGTSYKGSLWCAFPDRQRFPEPVDTFAVLGVLFGEWCVALVGLYALLRIAGRRKADTA